MIISYHSKHKHSEYTNLCFGAVLTLLLEAALVVGFICGFNSSGSYISPFFKKNLTGTPG